MVNILSVDLILLEMSYLSRAHQERRVNVHVFGHAGTGGCVIIKLITAVKPEAGEQSPPRVQLGSVHMRRATCM